MFGLSFVGFEFCAFAWDSPRPARPGEEADLELAIARSPNGIIEFSEKCLSILCEDASHGPMVLDRFSLNPLYQLRFFASQAKDFPLERI